MLVKEELTPYEAFLWNLADNFPCVLQKSASYHWKALLYGLNHAFGSRFPAVPVYVNS